MLSFDSTQAHTEPQEEDRMEEEEDATETTEMLIDVENLEIEGEEGARANMSRIEFWARGGLNQSCGKR